MMFSISDFFSERFQNADEPTLWKNLSQYHCRDEKLLSAELLAFAPKVPSAQQQATEWITALRQEKNDDFSIQDLMLQFSLDSDEGVVLMALSEALLRIPDNDTALKLIRDKLNALNPEKLLQQVSIVENRWLNSSLWGLLISQQILSSEKSREHIFLNLWQRLGEQTIIKALRFSIALLSQRFVFCETIQDALIQRNDYSLHTRFSFDMLGEASLCKKDVDSYFQAYLEAIQAAGAEDHPCETSISIKLTALHPRIENLQHPQVEAKLLHRLYQLLVVARHLDVAITIDAEESSRLEISLNIFSLLLRSELCKGWGRLGIAVQAYSKRAMPTLGWLEQLAKNTETRIPVRLVKGAYWDSEIKQAQKIGLNDYPVFTLKGNTDLSYGVCARFLLSNNCCWLQPQFATHNALTIAEVISLAKTQSRTFEFQRLHGMGENLYQKIQSETGLPCRIYAPIGPQQTLLPYLVRRLLENGSSSSFVLRLQDQTIPLEQLVTPPDEILHNQGSRNHFIPIPADIYLPQRENSAGIDLSSLEAVTQWQSLIHMHQNKQWYCQPIIDGEVIEGTNLEPIYAPYQQDKIIGYRSNPSSEQTKQAINSAHRELKGWQTTPLAERATILRRYAIVLQEHKDELIMLCMLETGKVLQDAIDELREAIDFCNYYAQLAETLYMPETLPSITGESNQLTYSGRGLFVTISPWNFPLAIFTGQIAAALVTGNCILAKPSSYSSLIAFRACELWYQAGLPPNCLQLLPYSGGQESDSLLNDSRITGVLFTGSTTTAQAINQQLAMRIGAPLSTLIAETGGQNTMLVDSSALIEQVVPDIIRSAFNSAGQRCSALRTVYLQHEIADEVEDKLIGAMNELIIGSPLYQQTDVGPVISQTAMNSLFEHIERLRLQERIIYEMPIDERHNNGFYVPPTLIKLYSLDELTEEHFGPVLHIIRYDIENIDRIIHEINRSGYGLTFGIHSRNEQFIEYVSTQLDVGNIYINRDQIGATVTAQPFGGMGQSGTGPKAGGPNYLHRLVREKTVTRNETAVGGDLSLLQQSMDGNYSED